MSSPQLIVQIVDIIKHDKSSRTRILFHDFCAQYVMAPISLVLLNPIGFLFLEIGERRKDMSTTNKPGMPSLASHPDGELIPERHAISRKISSSSTLSLVSNSSQRRSSGWLACWPCWPRTTPLQAHWRSTATVWRRS